MRITVAAVAVLAIALSACGTSVRTSPVEPSPSSRAPVPTATGPGVSSEPPITEPVAVETAVESLVESGEAPTEKPSSTEVPVSGPRERALAIVGAAGFLDEAGLVRLDADLPIDDDTLEALCTVTFGPTRAVAKKLKLPKELVLKTEQSALMGSDLGGFLICGYFIGDRAMVALEVGYSRDKWENGQTVLVADGAFHGVISYVPDYSGALIGKKAARSYLRTVLDTVAR